VGRTTLTDLPLYTMGILRVRTNGFTAGGPF
jgi:hypothetical protein